jgi:hypothetical protein
MSTIIPASLFCEEDVDLLNTQNINYSILGIDASINSTGVTLIDVDKSNITAKFYVITPGFIETAAYIENVNYEKNLHETRSNSNLEHNKLLNYQAISKSILDIIHDNTVYVANLHVSIEGIAYAAGRGGFGNKFKSKSSNIYDLAALNTIIRDRCFNLTRNQILSVPPKQNKARFVHGNANKFDMSNRFFEELSLPQLNLKDKANSYVFDVADSYAVGRNQMFMHFINNYKNE